MPRIIDQAFNPLEDKFPPLPSLPEKESRQVGQSGVREKDLTAEDEALMEKVVAAKAAVDELIQAFMRIDDINNWEPEEKWEMIEKMVKVSEVIAALQYPNDLAKQAEAHAHRMKEYIQVKGQIEPKVIEDQFIHEAGKWINETTKQVKKRWEDSMEKAA